ncbi:MAG: lytic transglycosylase domain-containing protein [Acidobacteria bacterium]|nr:MAG: lytic transglycosylase domain-containing protein [Acidobacteriota bacterium]
MKRLLRVWGRWVLMVAVLAVPARPAVAELVLLVGGHVLKVEGFALDGDRVRFELPSGGQLELSLLRIERIVDDEIEAEEVPLPSEIAPGIMLGFDDSHPVPETPFGDLIYATAQRYELNPELIAAVVRAESAFDPHAVSSKGAVGLLQLMPATGARYGVQGDALFDPARNLDAGVRYLKWLSERFAGDLPKMLAGYNAGEGTVERYDGVPPFRETRDFIRRIYSFLGVGS